MIDIGVARAKLDQFESADELAAFFRVEGIQGCQSLSDSCPIAEWMKKTTGQTISVSMTMVWNLDTSYHDPVNGAIIFGDRVDHTEALRSFVRKFDNGDYPDLVKPIGGGNREAVGLDG